MAVLKGLAGGAVFAVRLLRLAAAGGFPPDVLAADAVREREEADDGR